jgi:hypothetical protein
MNPTPFEYCIYIDNPDRLLLWLMLLCVLGSLVTSWMMAAISKFFLYRVSGEDELKKFSIMQLEFPWSFEKFKNLIDQMTDKTKDTVRMQLNVDYYFMPFIYLLLFFGGCFVLWYYKSAGTSISQYNFLLWIPVATWLFDIIENKLIASSLESTSKFKTNTLLFFALAKWIIAVLFFIAAVVAFIVIRSEI